MCYHPRFLTDMRYHVRVSGQLLGPLEFSDIEKRARTWTALNLPVQVSSENGTTFIPLDEFLEAMSGFSGAAPPPEPTPRVPPPAPMPDPGLTPAPPPVRVAPSAPELMPRVAPPAPAPAPPVAPAPPPVRATTPPRPPAPPPVRQPEPARPPEAVRPMAPVHRAPVVVAPPEPEPDLELEPEDSDEIDEPAPRPERGQEVYDADFDMASLSAEERREYAAHTFESILAVPAAVVLSIITANIFFVVNYALQHSRLPKIAFNDRSGGAALGFLFVPFYNMYWVCVVWVRLAKRINFQFRLRGEEPPIKMWLPITIVVLIFLSVFLMPAEGNPGLLFWFVNWLVFVPLFTAKLQGAINRLVDFPDGR